MKTTTSILAAIAAIGVTVSSMTYLSSMNANADETPKGSTAGAKTDASSASRGSSAPAKKVDLSKDLGKPVDNAILMKEMKLKDVVEGSNDAPITVIEYASMTCGHCARFHSQVYSELKKPFIESGKVKFILREFPLDDLAAGAFMLGRCVDEKKRAPLIDEMFASQNTWIQNPVPELLKLSKQAGLSKDEFEKCLGNQELLNKINEVREFGSNKLNVRGTPTFFINGRRLSVPGNVANLTRIFNALEKQGS